MISGPGSPPTDQNNLCTPRNVQPPKGALGPNLQSWAGDGASMDKENVSPSSSNGCPTVVSVAHSNQLGSVIPPGLPPIQTHLPMILCGQPINFDLQTLDDDPRPIIELLSATSSDRDKWMIVGAVYRRKGNIHAALTVVTTMVKGQQELTRGHSFFEECNLVLNDQGLRTCDMRPAFLMLSSCHVELWRQTRSADGSETETSAAHLDKSCRWLQLVYGQNNPEPMSENSSDIFDTLSPVGPASRRAPFVQDRIASDRWRRTGVERDLQALRDKQTHHVRELAHTREAKRRLENEAANERVTRRRLERALRDLETKLAKAQRRADDAHALVRMEVNTRRRCEQAIAEERAKRKALEEYLKKQAQSARPLLEGLAGLLQGMNGVQPTPDTISGSTLGGSPRR
jgi:hypothetical protein